MAFTTRGQSLQKQSAFERASAVNDSNVGMHRRIREASNASSFSFGDEGPAYTTSKDDFVARSSDAGREMAGNDERTKSVSNVNDVHAHRRIQAAQHAGGFQLSDGSGGEAMQSTSSASFGSGLPAGFDLPKKNAVNPRGSSITLGDDNSSPYTSSSQAAYADPRSQEPAASARATGRSMSKQSHQGSSRPPWAQNDEDEPVRHSQRQQHSSRSDQMQAPWAQTDERENNSRNHHHHEASPIQGAQVSARRARPGQEGNAPPGQRYNLITGTLEEDRPRYKK